MDCWKDYISKNLLIDFEGLCSKMLEIFETAGKETQLKILKSHPDLANKVAVNSLTKNSLVRTK